MIELIKNYLTNSRCYTQYVKLNPQGIMLHSVGCPQPNPDVFAKNWNNKTSNACTTGIIGTNKAYQFLPFDCKSWHCGTGTKGLSANATHLSFEMTEPSTIKYVGGATFVDNNPSKTLEHVKQTYANALEIFAGICIQFNFNPLGKTPKGYPVILSHSEGYNLGIASNHGDTEHLWSKTINKTMDDFRRELAQKISDRGYELIDGVYKQKEPVVEPLTIYNTVDECPNWAQEAIQFYVEKRALNGTGKGLNLTPEMARTLTIIYRAFEK